MTSFNPYTSHRPSLQIQSHQALGFQPMNLGEDTNIQCITIEERASGHRKATNDHNATKEVILTGILQVTKEL